MLKNKKGISTVVATVLIILITVAAVTIIWSAVVPMIRDNLEGGAACLNAVSQLSIIGNEGHSCVDDDGTVQVQIGRSAKEFELADIQMQITKSEGESDTMDLMGETSNWKTNSGTKVTFGDLPGINENKIFKITSEDYVGADKISIAAYVGSGASKIACEISATYDLIDCEGDVSVDVTDCSVDTTACEGNAVNTVCHGTLNTCVECEEDEDCTTTGDVCSTDNTWVCIVACTGDGDCASGETCAEGHCNT